MPAGYPLPPVRADEVVGALHCELASIYGADPRDGAIFHGWAAGAELNLTVSNTTAATPGLTVRPNLPRGKLTLPGSTTLSDTAKRDFKFRDFVSMAALNPNTATGAEVLASCPPLSHHSQGMGVGEALRELSRADARDGASHIEIEPTSMVVTFTATRSVDGGLTFEVPVVTASINNGKASRTAENKITITFKPDPLAPPPVTSGDRAFGLAPPSAQPSPQAIEILNRALDKLTEEKDTIIKVPPGQSVIIE